MCFCYYPGVTEMGGRESGDGEGTRGRIKRPRNNDRKEMLGTGKERESEWKGGWQQHRQRQKDRDREKDNDRHRDKVRERDIRIAVIT